MSGTYWYPPGAVREWHTNRFDVRDQPWRMYFVRLQPAASEAMGLASNMTQDAALMNLSAMHVLEPGADGVGSWHASSLILCQAF